MCSVKKKSPWWGLFCLSGETSATLNTTTLQNFLAVLGTITLHEAVFDFALALVWLVCPLWHNKLTPI